MNHYLIDVLWRGYITETNTTIPSFSVPFDSFSIRPFFAKGTWAKNFSTEAQINHITIKFGLNSRIIIVF